MTDTLLAVHPLEIYQACDTVFAGEKWLEWEPETILLELKKEISDAAMDKLLAVQAVAAHSNAVLRSAAAFEKTVHAFCNNICVMDVIQPPEVEEMSYAVSQIIKIIQAVHGSKVTIVFKDEVPGYVASVAHFRGWFMLPQNLSFAQEMLDTLTGNQQGSKLYTEHQHIRDYVSDIINSTNRQTAREILADPSIKALENNDTAALLVKHILGALLYDPTILYSDHA